MAEKSLSQSQSQGAGAASSDIGFYLRKVLKFSKILFRAYLLFTFCAAASSVTLLVLDWLNVYAFRLHPIALVFLAVAVFLVVFTFPMSVLFYCVSGICNFMLSRQNELFSYITEKPEDEGAEMPMPIEVMVYLLKVRWFAKTLFWTYSVLSAAALAIMLMIIGVYAVNTIPTTTLNSPVFMWLVFLLIVAVVAFPLSVLFYFVDEICLYLIHRDQKLYADKLMSFSLIEK